MPLHVFIHDPPSYATDEIGETSEYTHAFGGDLADHGYEILDAPAPLHLIYLLDQRDPLVPNCLPKASHIPLLYPFRYSGGCTYSVVGSCIKLIAQDWLQAKFPPWDAPAVFPSRPTAFTTQQYDPANPEHVMDWKGVFGWAGLNSAGLETALEIARQTTDIAVETHAPEDSWTYEQTVSAWYGAPFAQGPPLGYCDNPDCDSDRKQVIALQHEPRDHELIWPMRDVLTYWAYCPDCHFIEAGNQCT